MKQYDYLIVGAGMFGATFAHAMKQRGKKCLVIDRRNHLGGNTYCEQIEGINVHKYGPHIFHTSNKEIWDMVNAIVPFNGYINMPEACYEGKRYNLPFNLNTFEQMWGVHSADEAKAKIEEQRHEILQQLNGREPQNLEEQALSLVGRDIYERLIKGYTEKQWGRDCRELPAFIIKRLPVRLERNNNYFNDIYQGIPIGGYNRLTEGLLKDTETRTGADFCKERYELQGLADKIVYSGQIDEFYDYKLGHLEFRSVRFEDEIMDTSDYQSNAVVNYTERNIPYTRIIEHKHFEMFGEEVKRCAKSVVSREYPVEWHSGIEPYYPVNNDKNNNLFEQYKALSATEKNVIFGGRLGEYKYYDMAPVMERAIALAQSETNN